MDILVIMTIICNLILTVIFAVFNNFKLTRPLAYLNIGIYVCFIISSTIFAILETFWFTYKNNNHKSVK